MQKEGGLVTYLTAIWRNLGEHIRIRVPHFKQLRLFCFDTCDLGGPALNTKGLFRLLTLLVNGLVKIYLIRFLRSLFYFQSKNHCILKTILLSVSKKENYILFKKKKRRKTILLVYTPSVP